MSSTLTDFRSRADAEGWGPPFPEQEYERRKARVIRAMDQRGIDTLLVTSPVNIAYLTGYDMIWYYLRTPTAVAVEARSGVSLFFELAYHAPTVGYHALSAVLLALEQREQTGKGSTVEVPQAETLATLYAPELIAVQLGAPIPSHQGNQHAWMAPHNAYRVNGQDEWITIAIANNEEFATLCDALEISSLARDARFEHAEARKLNEEPLDALLAKALQDHDPYELEQNLQARGVMALRVDRGHELEEDPGLAHINYLQWLDRSIGGELPYRTAVFRFDDRPTTNVRPPPLLGEHNHELLTEFFGISIEEISTLEKQGVIGTVPGGIE